MRPSAPSVAAPPTAPPPARSGLRDAFVLCAMAVVVLAFGLGLHLQFRVDGQSALVAAIVVWMALIVMHVAVRRAHAVARAGAETANADADGEGVDLKRVSASVAPPRRPRATALPEEPPLRSKPPPLPASARAPAPHPRPPDLPREAPPDTLRRPLEVQPSLPLPRPDVRDQERRPEPAMGWDLRPGAHHEPADSGPRPAVFPPLEAAAPAPAAAKETIPAPARFARHEPAFREGGVSSQSAAPASDRAAPGPGASADGGGTEPRSMQHIIDQLAKQLRAPADADTAGTAAGSSEPQAGTEQAIARSVEALKAAGGAMRAAQDGGQTLSAGSRLRESAPEAARSTDDAGAPHASSPQTGAATVAQAVARQSLEVCLDSILSLEDRKTRHFEMTVRMRLGAGEPVAIDDYALVQAGDGLRGRLDAAKLARVARIAGPLSKRGLSAALFVSLAAESLIDDTFLDACAGVIANQPDIVHQLVPSFSQGELRSFIKPHWETLATLKENGIKFGLERLGDLAMDFAILKERGFHFVKIDAGMLLAGMQAHDGVISALQVRQRVADAGLDLIVGRIDDDATLAQVGGLGVVYGQGTFFGVPRPVKIDLKAPHEAAA